MSSIEQAPIDGWPAGWTGSGHPARAEGRLGPSPAALRRRRLFVLALNLATVAALTAAMAAILGHGGLIALEWAMLGAYVITLAWLSIGLWNSIIGLRLDLRHGARAAEVVLPALGRVTGGEPITARVALVMPLRNEDPAVSLARLRGIQQELARTPWAGRFDIHVLSDSDRPDIVAREELEMARWRRMHGDRRLFYRRRTDNAGYKAGNVGEFVQRHRDTYDFFLPLDADSVMGADAILRMVRVMQASPEIGMLQSLITGLPSRVFFVRAFQFGLRHVMRSFTLGSAWWQADCGPNWGHNVLIRTAPFADHCMLEKLPGKGPLSGWILSHDMLEAALMRRAGYEVRVLAEECDSHEENPPSVVDFIRRELRWANGNLQYLRLTGLDGIQPVSRVQLALAVLAYVGAPAWLAFVLLGSALTVAPGQYESVPLVMAFGFFAFMMTMNLFPKLMGLAQVMADSARAAQYGGRARVALGGVGEIVFSMLFAPAVAFALTMFVIGLVFGRRVGWQAQQRSRERLHWGEAAGVLWPQTVTGFALTGWFWATAPVVLPFAAPVLIPLAGAIPIAVLSTHPALGRWSCAVGLFDIPEDRSSSSDVAPVTPARAG